MSYKNQGHVRRHWLTVPSVDTLMSSASSRLALERFQPQRDCLCLIPLLAVRTNIQNPHFGFFLVVRFFQIRTLVPAVISFRYTCLTYPYSPVH